VTRKTWIIMDGDAGTLLPGFNGDSAAWRFLQTGYLLTPITSPLPGRSWAVEASMF
jgi:hypothetical protein